MTFLNILNQQENSTFIDIYRNLDYSSPLLDIGKSLIEQETLKKTRGNDRCIADDKYWNDHVRTQCESNASTKIILEKKFRLIRSNSDDKTYECLAKCAQCPMTFRYKRHLDRHLEGHQKNNCPRCSAKFARKKHLDVHLFRAHGETALKHPHSCDVCYRGFPKRILLHRHKAKHHGQDGKISSICSESLPAETQAKEQGEKRFHCELCSQFFDLEETYRLHLQNHNNFKCSHCGVELASKKKVEEHRRTCHSSKPKDATVKSNGLYFCTDCQHGFVKKVTYQRHLDTVVHRSKSNEDVPSKETFPCPICPKVMSSRRAREQHVRRVHKDEKRFTCDVHGCEFQSASRSDLDRHRQLHIEERNVVCDQCGKAFTSVNVLKDHVLYMHSKERQFVCEECGKSFKRNSLLKRHKLSHQQVRPFACIECNSAFKRSHHLTRHLETCHKVTLERKKMVKLMKTEGGHLVPIPEKPKKPRPKRPKAKKNPPTTVSSKEEPNGPSEAQNFVTSTGERSDSTTESTVLVEGPGGSLESPGSLPTGESTPRVVSLVGVSSGQVVTVELTSPTSMPINDFMDQFEGNCSEMLELAGYHDLEFQQEILSTDQSYYDHDGYSELPLESGETSLLLDSNGVKMDTLPAIENYLTQPFSPFLNL
ncbi:zinc finger protein 284 isoform X2 [Orussus abietinus]|nr:zinc finger protein 284 isoform X2 [Orussus abietinus]